MKLIIGNKNYSSWSLRPWLLMRVKNVSFEEERIPLRQPDTAARIAHYSPAGKVPVLIDGATAVWDSLAIAEYLAERFPDRHFWPADSKARALARSITAEMHSGFSALRSTMPMNCRATLTAFQPTPEAATDIARIISLWEQCRTKHGHAGNFLFGEFCIADAFYAPVASRFITYGLPLNDVIRGYVNAIHGLPEMREWLSAAKAESKVIEAYELGR